MFDDVQRPSHYVGRGGIEPLEFIESNKLSFLEGNIIKYVFRHTSKNGLQDLYKAKFYLERLIDQVTDDNKDDESKWEEGFSEAAIPRFHPS